MGALHYSLIQVSLDPEREEYRNVGVVVQHHNDPPVFRIIEGENRAATYSSLGALPCERANLDRELEQFTRAAGEALDRLPLRFRGVNPWGPEGDGTQLRLGPSHALREAPVEEWVGRLFERLVLPRLPEEVPSP